MAKRTRSERAAQGAVPEEKHRTTRRAGGRREFLGFSGAAGRGGCRA
jgi:hypothetical protein